MLKGVFWGIALSIVCALIGGYVLVKNGLISANTDAKPCWIETWMAGISLDATLEKSSERVKKYYQDFRVKYAA